MREFIGLISGTLTSMTPVLLAALGGAFTYYSGMFNIAMEGMLLVGAFCAVLGGYFSGSWLIGLGCALLGSVVVALLFVLFAIVLRTDEFVTGIALNLLAVGATTYALRQVFGTRGAFQDPAIPAIPSLWVPILTDLPLIGPLLFGQNVIVYVALALVSLSAVLLFRTRFGLRLRAAGHNAQALDIAGVSARRVRATALLLCGVYCGVGGAFLSTGYLQLFGENMSAGRGWIALAAIILVSGNPWGIAVIALLFGFADGAGLLLQSTGMPSQITDTLPYVATLIALWVYARRVRPEPS
ncbi:MAG TPA: ABC transporter permease [Anaerolineales bacterium]|nr:ABC transporter permease [Anaerolineales bacterium]